ncbi:hypothetical protein FRC17_001227 [Serendipita sp. 399]|nr:hypothetical protein FRC17_001227 [Serendipita sp. 399]
MLAFKQLACLFLFFGMTQTVVALPLVNSMQVAAAVESGKETGNVVLPPVTTSTRETTTGPLQLPNGPSIPLKCVACAKQGPGSREVMQKQVLEMWENREKSHPKIAQATSVELRSPKGFTYFAKWKGADGKVIESLAIQ